VWLRYIGTYDDETYINDWITMPSTATDVERVDVGGKFHETSVNCFQPPEWSADSPVIYAIQHTQSFDHTGDSAQVGQFNTVTAADENFHTSR
jgi:hypothetical protein